MLLRALTFEDEPLIWQFLMLAAHENSVQAVREMPELARYAAGWGREGDFGIVAFEENHDIGAAWLRWWTTPEKGFAWLADDVPELAMAVAPEWRGRGIGTQLLDAILQEARADWRQLYQHQTLSRLRAISLSVRADNPALRLYQRAGFKKVAGRETLNRVGSTSLVMQLIL